MSATYKKAADLDEKVKELQLPYFQWKVLFMVAEGVTVDEMAETLEEKPEDIEKALYSLDSEGLIEAVSETETEPEVAEPDTVQEEEPEESSTEETDETELELEEIQETEEADISEEMKEEEANDTVAELQDEPEAESSETSEVGDFLAGVNEMAGDKAEPEPEPEQDTAVAEEPQPQEPEEETITSDVSKKSIIVIDDSIVIRKMIEIALEEEEFRIVTATSGEEGLTAMEKDDPSLVILDMLLPDMNGIDLLKQIKERKDIPVIMLSGKDSPQMVENAKEVGVDDFLPKPFRDEELVEKVKNLVS